MMAKGYGPGRLVVSYRVKGEHNLSAVLRPMALLVCVVFADVQGCQNRSAVWGEIEGENTLRCVGRRGFPLVNSRHLLICSEERDAAGRNEPAESQQTTRKQGEADHAE
jgi:hypothetical protein